MQEYQLEIKQIVDYPRCRVYREFVRSLMKDRNIHTRGCSGLFFYTVLCSYANFRTSYRRIDGISYTVYPGEWICSVAEVRDWFRVRTKRQALKMLQEFADRKLISYSLLGHGNLIRYSITDWRRHNKVLDYNCPCQKDTGFFFMPVSIAAEMVGMGRCSEMDIIIDMWLNSVYNDKRVLYSSRVPMVYFRNGSGKPFVSYADLSQRWGISKSTVCRVLKRLMDHGYIHYIRMLEEHGTVILLKNYLSTMFQMSDILIDKDELALAISSKIKLPDDGEPKEECSEPCIPEAEVAVSKSDRQDIVHMVLKFLERQGIPCASCEKLVYKLYTLSDGCKGLMEGEDLLTNTIRYRLELCCHEGTLLYAFELSLYAMCKEEGSDHAQEKED